MAAGTTTTFAEANRGPGPLSLPGKIAVWYLRLVVLFDLVAVISFSVGREVHRHEHDGGYGGFFFTPFLLTASLVSAALAAFLAVTLRRRKHVAWVCTILLVAFTSLADVYWLSEYGYRAHWMNWVAAAVTVALLLCLVWARKDFYAKGEDSNPKTALAVLVIGAAVATAVGTAMLTWFGTVGDSGLADRIEYVLLRLGTVDKQDVSGLGINSPHWLDLLINVMSLVLFLTVVYALFRSPRGQVRRSEQDEERLRELLAREPEPDSLGYFALRRDKSVIFSPSGKAAIAYRAVGGVSLASGDPLGDPEAWPGAIELWLREAAEHAWSPAVAGASEQAGEIYARHGLTALELGDEAIVEVPEFTLDGRAMRTVRQAVNKVKRAGYTARIRRHKDIPPEEMSALGTAADHWRYGQPERGFSMALNRLGDPADGECMMIECFDPDGRMRALLSYVPWGMDGLSLDLMRRDKDSDNGLVEFMVIELLQRADEYGVARVSLNFAMFRAVFERGSKLGAGPVLRLWRSVLLFFSRWWQIESLYRANAKYRPIWEPRFVLYARSADLPRIGLAYARVEGFLAPPQLPWRRGGSGPSGPGLPSD
ncbi:phosphatidylglycerol lysyltransferase domain-containing protein [Actinospica robiniae]|uniref:phosphatidylglycerol lysyltransferase domain-containing protein n=1 Tax=Actinospica robiniae TaxID=304901 RepID=UPI00041D3012|nr:phosphatidylglycerol lysyltransferase domain-containing protein [Actinospica robiniae]